MTSPTLFLLEDDFIKILAIDQARNGAWAIGESDTGELLDYGTFSFIGKKYTYAQAIVKIEELINRIIDERAIDVVFVEDIQMQRSVLSYKRLAQLQGVLINLFEKKKISYGYILPAKWQSYCRKKLKSSGVDLKKNADTEKKETKALSLLFVREQYDIDTENDNLADAISILNFIMCSSDISQYVIK